MTRAREHLTVLLPHALAFWIHEQWTLDLAKVEGSPWDSPQWRSLGDGTHRVALAIRYDSAGRILLENDEGNVCPVPEVVGPFRVHQQLYDAHWLRVCGWGR
jgi:hypothetical protein